MVNRTFHAEPAAIFAVFSRCQAAGEYGATPMKIPIVDDLIELFRGEHLTPTAILLTSVAMLVTWKTAGSQSFFHQHAAEWLPTSLSPVEAAAWYQMAMGLLLLGIVPRAGLAICLWHVVGQGRDWVRARRCAGWCCLS